MFTYNTTFLAVIGSGAIKPKYADIAAQTDKDVTLNCFHYIKNSTQLLYKKNKSILAKIGQFTGECETAGATDTGIS